MITPTQGSITQHFGENPQVYARWDYPGHNGLDLAGQLGQPVLAVAAGRVANGYEPAGYGTYIEVDHGGFSTLYAHLAFRLVNDGQPAAAGEVLGGLGSTGFSSGPHLHFEVRIPGQGAPGYRRHQVDPLPYLQGEKSLPALGSPEGEAPEVVTGRVLCRSLLVRSRPSTQGAVVSRLAHGDEIALHALTAVWAQIGRGRYVALRYDGEELVALDADGLQRLSAAGRGA
ncbi:MAG: M23 family metallopeptidase [Anaerolineae bacterium]|nr:M23 family metallopeptidase [Anaerolineae bacterium]